MPIEAVGNQQNTREAIEAATKNVGSRNTGELGKDDFLKLLVTQLRYQDPLSPMDDKEFIAQMAQFSALEQMQNLNSTFSSVQALNMVGKYIVASKYSEGSGETQFVEGIVDSVRVISGKAYLDVDNVTVSVNDVTQIMDASVNLTDTNISSYAKLIGFNATGHIGPNENGSYLAVKGKVKALEKGYYEDYAVMDGVKVELFEIVSGIPLNTNEAVEEYLSYNINNEVTLKANKPGEDVIVEVKGKLRSYVAGENGAVEVELDDVYVPVESITKLTGGN